jgi:20S proteasome alpha/beta subunit
MSKDEALKLALEALESADWYIDQLEMIVYCVDDDGIHESRAKVQAAIKEALAQPEQGLCDMGAMCLGCSPE